MAARLPDDCRIKCEQCHGHGSADFFEVVECLSCQRGIHDAPCITHACRACSGSGKVCPECRGMRFVRSNVFRMSSYAGQNVREVTRCPVCCEGNNVNVEREREAILRYEAKWTTWEAEAAAASDPIIDPQAAMQRDLDAETREQQRAFEENQRGKARDRQRKRISRSREVESQLDGQMPAPLPLKDFSPLRDALPKRGVQ